MRIKLTELDMFNARFIKREPYVVLTLVDSTVKLTSEPLEGVKRGHPAELGAGLVLADLPAPICGCISVFESDAKGLDFGERLQKVQDQVRCTKILNALANAALGGRRKVAGQVVEILAKSLQANDDDFVESFELEITEPVKVVRKGEKVNLTNHYSLDGRRLSSFTA